MRDRKIITYKDFLKKYEDTSTPNKENNALKEMLINDYGYTYKQAEESINWINPSTLKKADKLSEDTRDLYWEMNKTSLNKFGKPIEISEGERDPKEANKLASNFKKGLSNIRAAKAGKSSHTLGGQAFDVRFSFTKEELKDKSKLKGKALKRFVNKSAYNVKDIKSLKKEHEKEYGSKLQHLKNDSGHIQYGSSGKEVQKDYLRQQKLNDSNSYKIPEKDRYRGNTEADIESHVQDIKAKGSYYGGIPVKEEEIEEAKQMLINMQEKK